MCTVTVHPSLVESILEKGLSNTTSFLGLSACQLQAVEHGFPTVLELISLIHPQLSITVTSKNKRNKTSFQDPMTVKIESIQDANNVNINPQTNSKETLICTMSLGPMSPLRSTLNSAVLSVMI